MRVSGYPAVPNFLPPILKFVSIFRGLPSFNVSATHKMQLYHSSNYNYALSPNARNISPALSANIHLYYTRSFFFVLSHRFSAITLSFVIFLQTVFAMTIVEKSVIDANFSKRF